MNGAIMGTSPKPGFWPACFVGSLGSHQIHWCLVHDLLPDLGAFGVSSNSPAPRARSWFLSHTLVLEGWVVLWGAHSGAQLQLLWLGAPGGELQFEPHCFILAIQ